MKRMIMLVVLLLLLPLSAAMGASDLEDGKRYFSDSSLGSNGKSCASCHPSGKGLENACDYDVPTLQEFVNFCIRDAMKGKMLPADDPRIIEIERLMRASYCRQ